MFELKIQIIGADALEISEDGIELITAPALLLAGPQGQAMPLQMGLIRTPMSKEAAQELIDKIQAAIDGVEYEPKKDSGLVVAQSLAGVEQAANLDKKLKGK